MGIKPPPETKTEQFVRFMVNVKIGVACGDCWIWTANRPSGKYGHFPVMYKSIKAHRWMYEHAVGPIPNGLLVRHKCDNPPCVNPNHLEVGTSKDNCKDMLVRGRRPDRHGEKHPLARLKADQVLEIRKLASCGATQKALSLKFNVGRGQIGKIVHRTNWRHI